MYFSSLKKIGLFFFTLPPSKEGLVIKDFSIFLSTSEVILSLLQSFAHKDKVSNHRPFGQGIPPCRCVQDSCLQLGLTHFSPFVSSASLWFNSHCEVKNITIFSKVSDLHHKKHESHILLFLLMVICCLLVRNAVISISGKSNPKDMETKRKPLASDICLMLVTSGIFALHEFVPEC